MPIILLPRWIAGLLSLSILAAALYLLWSWGQGHYYRDLHGDLHQVQGPDWKLWTGVGLMGWSLLGRFVVLMFLPREPREPQVARSEGHRITGGDGASLWVETYGPQGAPTLVFTHGWGMDSSSWNPLKAAFADRYRLVLWDLPGLGRSKGPSGGKYTLEGFAADLRAVVEDSGAERVVLVGHSIGGMTTQTLVRDHAEFVRERVAGMALVDTTYVNPLETMILSGLWKALRFLLIEPLCWLQIALSPIVHLMNWKSWLDGTALIVMRLTGFGERPSRETVDHCARLAAYNSPGVQAKGNLAMFRWSVDPALARFDLPTVVLGGTKDIVTLPRASAHLAQAIPGAELVAVQGVGHMGFMEKPKEYADAIGAFASRVLAPSGPVGPGTALG